MRQGKWWVQESLLTSGMDPTVCLNSAAKQFGDEYVPMLFMTGDGHREPPFAWTERGVWQRYFSDLAINNLLCCHVETYADAVTKKSVPDTLAQVFYNKKVFGWEPEFYKTIESILIRIPDFIFNEDLSFAADRLAIQTLVADMQTVSQAGYLQQQVLLANNFLLHMNKLAEMDEVYTLKSMLREFCKSLKEYERAAMNLRVEINDVIGANIQQKIDENPDKLHLIACGYRHIDVNPLYQYVTPPIGTFGVADRNNQ